MYRAIVSNYLWLIILVRLAKGDIESVLYGRIKAKLMQEAQVT